MACTKRNLVLTTAVTLGADLTLNPGRIFDLLLSEPGHVLCPELLVRINCGVDPLSLLGFPLPLASCSHSNVVTSYAPIWSFVS